MSRIPDDAFNYYFRLGADRSYQAVADRFGVSKRSVTKHALREEWQERIDEIEKKARQQADEKAMESLEAMTTRHLRALKAIQGRALEALKNMPLSSAMEAVRALDMSIKQERVIRGEPADRSAVTVEEVVKREYQRWMGEDEDGL
jgi:hypothetical protein